MSTAQNFDFTAFRGQAKTHVQRNTRTYWRAMRVGVRRLARSALRSATKQACKTLDMAGGSLRGNRVVHECMDQGV